MKEEMKSLEDRSIARPWEQRFTDEQIKAMLARGACMCGIEAAQRNRFDTRATLVPTSPNCEAHRG